MITNTPPTTHSATPTGTAPNLNGSDLVYSVREVAEHLKISQWTVNKLIRERRLRSIQIGARRLVPTIDLEEYLRELRNAENGLRYGN